MRIELELARAAKASVKRVVLRATTLVGRSKECDLRIASSRISRKHCRIHIEDGAVRVTDLGSSNGTYVDSDKVLSGETVTLLPGAKISLGGIKFVVNYDPDAVEETVSEAKPDESAHSTVQFDHDEIATAVATTPDAEDELPYTAAVSDEASVEASVEANVAAPSDSDVAGAETTRFKLDDIDIGDFDESASGDADGEERFDSEEIEIDADDLLVEEDESEEVAASSKEVTVAADDSDGDQQAYFGGDDDEDAVADFLLNDDDGEGEEQSAGMSDELGDFLKQLENK
ncbi:FHA domain-containing protein [Stratiformator vulcanicus]|uniref:Glycogen accumulation regulator GarA n=1 Tax=Stratiformator vulcanicus TaxID=2527980 RepID=A0A517R290_9PLAN|nr:FHA domain-containing protein [Stratiformator vulcanicus]QDT37974.1 Glycogen accumulation regulator GarA [Stratiformator vulcanicus]